MIRNIQPTIERIRETDFASASHAKARAIFGILSVLKTWVDDGDELMQKLVQCQPTGFLQEEQTIDGYAQADTLWATLPLKERLLRLIAFYHENIHLLSGGDDRRARQLLRTAERAFEQCREEVFAQCDTHIEEFLLYFHVLCLAHPGYRHPDNVRLYRKYTRFFDGLPMEDVDPNSDLMWQYREVRWRKDMLHEQFFDLSLLPRLAFADKDACEAFRLQCYRWMLFLDPENDGSIQTQVQNWTFASKGVRTIYAWLDAKYTDGIGLQPEEEATALLTLYCGINAGPYDQDCLACIEDRAYDLLERLPASRLKTHLMAQIATANEDPDLQQSVAASLSAWPPATLTQEDKYLLELMQA